jgi:hypothetical protein
MNLFRNSVFVLLAIFVVLISMGVNVFKFNCDKNNNLYFGYEDVKCSYDIDCCDDLIIESCCDVSLKCCSVNVEDDCSKENQSIQYNFETVFKYIEIPKVKSLFIFYALNLITEDLQLQGSYTLLDFSPLITEVILSEIQVFLI